jgi:hypothetical protein
MNTFSEGQDIQKIEEEIRTQIFLKKSTVLSLERQNLTSFIIRKFKILILVVFIIEPTFCFVFFDSLLFV